MNTTGKQLVDHWTWAAEKGVMNKNSAGALRAACSQVLSVLDNWQELDVASIDVDDVIRRFENLRARDFNPESLHAYGKRFRRGVESFLEYTKNPSAWKSSSRSVRPSMNAGEEPSEKKPTKSHREVATLETALESVPTHGLIEYPFPLRENIVVRLKLPRDFSAAEAKRLYGFMLALAVDHNSAP